MIGYSAANVQTQTAVFNTTPNGSRGGIWQGGRGLVVLDSGSLLAETGNGTNSETDVANSVIKLRGAGVFQGVFTPADFEQLDAFDLDLSSTGPLFIPSRGLLIASGKQGMVYVLDQYPNPVQSFQATSACEGGYEFDGCHKVFSTAFWDNSKNPLL